MNIRQDAPAGSPADAKISAAWPGFVERLAGVLEALQEDQYLVINLKGTNRFVQFAGQGAWGVRAECVSNAFLSDAEKLGEPQQARLRELGWRKPTGTPVDSTPERDPDGSPNHFVEWPWQEPLVALAEMAVRTMIEVLGVPHPGFLEYEATDSRGKALVFEALALRRAVHPTPADLYADLERRLLAVVREFTAVDELDYDDDRDIQFGYGSTFICACLAGKPLKVRVRAILVAEVEESLALLQRLNELNAGLGSMHLLFARGSIQAVCETPAWPFVPEQVQRALLDFCEICDGLDELLQAEFGGTIFRDQRMLSLARH